MNYNSTHAFFVSSAYGDAAFILDFGVQISCMSNAFVGHLRRQIASIRTRTSSRQRRELVRTCLAGKCGRITFCASRYSEYRATTLPYRRKRFEHLLCVQQPRQWNAHGIFLNRNHNQGVWCSVNLSPICVATLPLIHQPRLGSPPLNPSRRLAKSLLHVS